MSLKALYLILTAFFSSYFISPQYTQGVVGFPKTFYSINAQTDAEKAISKILFRGIVRYDDLGEIQPDLADEVIASKDSKDFRVRLKNDIYFSNGQAITTDDVIFTLRLRPEFSDIVMQKINSKIIEFKLPNELSSFPDLLTVGIVSSKDSFNNTFSPVSSGYYQVASVDKIGDVAVSVKLKSTDKTKTKFQIIEIKFYENYTKVVEAATQGSIQGFLSPDIYESKIFTAKKYIVNGRYVGLYFNTKGLAASDLELRKTLSADVPRQSIIDKVFSGNAASYEKFYKGTKWSFEEATKLTQSEQKFNGVKFKLAYPSDETYRKIAEELVRYWGKYDINFELDEVKINEVGDMLNEIQTRDAIIVGAEISRDPDQFAFWHSTQNKFPGLNLSNYVSVRTDTALEEGRKVSGFDERKVHYNVLQETLIQDAPAIPLYKPVYYFNYLKKFSFADKSDLYTPVNQLYLFLVN